MPPRAADPNRLNRRASKPNSLHALEAAWSESGEGRRRAAGGRNALHGFSFQIAISINEFLDLVGQSASGDPGISFDALSDLALANGDLVYVHQVKATLDKTAAISVAREALAVDEFLERHNAELRERFRFKPLCGRTAGSFDPRDLSPSELSDDSTVQERWHEVRNRVLEPEVKGDPFLQLCIRLFQGYEAPFQLASALVGALFEGLGANETSDQLAARLLTLLDDARKARQIQPPGRLLSPEDFVGQAAGNSILLGQRPTLGHLASGYFMDRIDRVEMIVSAIHESADVEREGLPVHWITGASGAGKSVLLLQVLKRLVQEGSLPVHHIGHLPSELSGALEYWRHGSTSSLIIGIDDLYAPGHRGEQVWEAITALALDKGLAERITVITASPLEYCEAFEKMALREEAFQVERSLLSDLEPEEKTAFAHWYEERTGTRTTTVEDPVFVEAAFRAEIGRAGSRDAAEFANRFLARVDALGGDRAVLASLALNRLGLSAPASLFAECRGVLDRLDREEIAQLDREEGTETLTLYHQRLASTLYQALVPSDDLESRARHLADGFAAMLSTPRLAGAFLHGLSAQRKRLSQELRQRLLAYLWEEYWAKYPTAAHIELLIPWVFESLASELDILQPPYGDTLVDLVFAETTPSSWTIAIWRVLRRGNRREQLDREAREWLADHLSDPSWAELYRSVLQTARSDEWLLDIGEKWLQSNPGHEDWVAVFVVVAPHRKDCAELAVTALDKAPVSKYDVALWEIAARHTTDRGLVVRRVTRRICRAPTRKVFGKGLKFVARNASGHEKSVRGGLELETESARWTAVVRGLIGVAPGTRLSLLVKQTGTKWLEEHIDADDWPTTWHAIFQASFQHSELKGRLLSLACLWLDNNEFKRFWLLIADQLRTDTPSLGLEYLKLWLAKQMDHPIWRLKLAAGLEEFPDDPDLRQLGLDWLDSHPRSRTWLSVFATLWTDPPAPDLIDLGWKRLASRPSRKALLNYWNRVVSRPPQDPRIKAEVEERLLQNQRASADGWPKMVTTLIGPDSDPRLALAATRWLGENEADPEWPYVWTALVGVEPTPEPQLISMGESWLRAHPGTFRDAMVRKELDRLNRSA